jgi:hypothetical protein
MASNITKMLPSVFDRKCTVTSSSNGTSMECGEVFVRNTPHIGQNMHSLKIELAESYSAAAAASTASEELLAKLLSKYQSAAITANSRISIGC